MNIQAHEAWLGSLKLGGQNQKSLRILDPMGENKAKMIDITILDNSESEGAEESGWVVDVRYQNAPDQTLFTLTQPTEGEARKIMDDLVSKASAIEGLIRQEDFEGARVATDEFLNTMSANTGESHIEETENA